MGERSGRMGMVALLSAAAAALGACGSNAPTRSTATAGPARIAPTPCGTNSGRGCAPPSRRVDLVKPSFSHPTRITNPLFPIGGLRSVVLLGHLGAKPFRTETTLLPGTRSVEWNHRRIRVLVSQYVAYVDGRLDQVALDRYAQADDGSVWYFGEDVFVYAHGTIANTEGTWRAGREGPAAMIMPARPKVGQVFRTENEPGIVFEEVTVKAVGRTVVGPHGPIGGAMIGSELHPDATAEDKVFAPGYGEFRTAGRGELEALALAVPADSRPGPPPAALDGLSSGVEGVLESARVGDWKVTTATLARLQAQWRAVRSGQPPMVAARLDATLGALARAVRARKAAPVTQAAVDVGQPVLDLELRYRPREQVDAARFHLWTQQLRVDAAARDLAGVTGDVAVLEWIRDRIAPSLGPAGAREIDTRLTALRIASDARNLPAAADRAALLGAQLRELAPVGPSG
jgi:hypothetical protein